MEPIKNSFQVPNACVDRLMALLTPEEWKVLCYAMRRTFGFNRDCDRISLTQFCSGQTARDGRRLDLGTGLGRKAVIDALHALLRYGVLVQTATDNRTQGAEYRIGDAECIDWPAVAARAEEREARQRSRTQAARVSTRKQVVGSSDRPENVGSSDAPRYVPHTNVGSSHIPTSVRRTNTQNTEKPRETQSTAAETSTASAPVIPPLSREAAKRQRIADALFDFFHRPATRDQVDDLLADVEEYRKRGIKVSAAVIEQATKDARRWWDSTSRTGNPCRIEPVRKALSDLVAPKQDAPATAAAAAPVPDPLAESTVELRPMWEIWEEERAREAARIPRIPPHLVPLLMKGRDLTPEQQAECDEQERRWQAQQREFAKPIPHVRMLVRDGAAASSASVN